MIIHILGDKIVQPLIVRSIAHMGASEFGLVTTCNHFIGLLPGGIVPLRGSGAARLFCVVILLHHRHWL